MKVIAGRATATWDRFRKERDFHRMHHKRVGQEKNNLVRDLARLRKHFAHYEPTIKELRHKYEVAMKEKMLMRLERDRLAAKVESLEAQLKSLEAPPQPQETPPKPKVKKTLKRSGDSLLPPSDRENPLQRLQFEPVDVGVRPPSPPARGGSEGVWSTGG